VITSRGTSCTAAGSFSTVRLTARLVRDLADLAQLVGDEDNRPPLIAERPHHRDQLVNLLRSQDSSRFVEDQVLRVVGEGFQDLDPLLDADRQVLHDGVGVDGEVVARRQLTDPAPGCFHVEQPGRTDLPTEYQVLRHREDLDQHEVLMHHPDPGCHGLLRVVEVHRSAVDEDLPAVGLQQPVQHVHQRRLTSAVLAQQAVDLTRTDVQVDRVVGHQGPEPLGNAAELQTPGRPVLRSDRGPVGLSGHTTDPYTPGTPHRGRI
jgi:hypothetical protein